MNGILSVSSFCEVCSAVSRSISWARCLPVVTAESVEHLRDAEQNNTDASKPVARHFNLPNHSHHNMIICGLYLHHGNTESRKNLEQKLIFQLGTLSPHGINERLSFH